MNFACELMDLCRGTQRYQHPHPRHHQQQQQQQQQPGPVNHTHTEVTGDGLIDWCRGTQEVEAVLSEDNEETGAYDPLDRLKMAMNYEEKKVRKDVA